MLTACRRAYPHILNLSLKVLRLARTKILDYEKGWVRLYLSWEGILESRGIGRHTYPAQQIFDIFCLALGTATASYEISQSARLRNLDSDFSDRMRFLLQCDSVFVLLGAITGKDNFTFLSFMNAASFSDNYCVTLGKLSLF
jgi:hypothetical protein